MTCFFFVQTSAKVFSHNKIRATGLPMLAPMLAHVGLFRDSRFCITTWDIFDISQRMRIDSDPTRPSAVRSLALKTSFDPCFSSFLQFLFAFVFQNFSKRTNINVWSPSSKPFCIFNTLLFFRHIKMILKNSKLGRVST